MPIGNYYLKEQKFPLNETTESICLLCPHVWLVYNIDSDKKWIERWILVKFRINNSNSRSRKIWLEIECISQLGNVLVYSKEYRKVFDGHNVVRILNNEIIMFFSLSWVTAY